jgi:elongator complex protein 2
MTIEDVSVEYISASANRFNRTAAASPGTSIVAFGSGKLVALWDAQVSFSLVGAVI